MKSRPWIYIIGPYTGANATEQWDNCMAARAWAEDIWENGGACVCPQMNSFMLDEAAPHGDFVAAYIILMYRCDGVVVLNGWRKSKGSVREVAAARKAGLPIWFYSWKDGKNQPEDVCLGAWIAGLKTR